MRARRQPRIVYVCGREPAYVRNRLLIRGLGQQFPLKTVVSDSPTYPRRLAATLPAIISASRNADLIVAGFLGQPYAFLAGRLLGKPVLLDAFVSVYDTLCLDRRRFSERGILGRALFELERATFSAARLILVDTASQARFFSDTFGLHPERFRVHYLGPDFEALVPRRTSAAHAVDVLHYGSYLPLHGTDIIVQAAARLRHNPTIRFRLIGRGPRYGAVRKLADECRLGSITFVDWLDPAALSGEIAQATIGLGGHFAENPKARRVIAGKTFQLLAAGLPTIVGDCVANREIFTPGVHVEMVPLADPASLADVIANLAENQPHQTELGKRGESLMRSTFSDERIAGELRLAVERALDQSESA